ncbi:hypothetical protein [Bacillus massiliigorillae]|uniref:hypothetical protein n=1 Tax=Bacillus massiliigorillae TaxID=1243664 RepID=UPI0003A573BD|nr:hypothetical protein [Bacillus massiliigorillae]
MNPVIGTAATVATTNLIIAKALTTILEKVIVNITITTMVTGLKIVGAIAAVALKLESLQLNTNSSQKNKIPKEILLGFFLVHHSTHYDE